MKKYRKYRRKRSDPLTLANRISFVLLIVSLAAAYCIAAVRLTGTLTPTMELIDGHAAIRFVDVGQGDCTLIVHRGHAVLIDAGSAWGSYGTADYISTYAPKIDAFFVTHPHEDHMGGASAVLRRCRVKELYLSEAVSQEEFYPRTLEDAEKEKTSVVRLTGGGEYLFGDIRVEVYDTSAFPYEELNDASLAMRVSVDGMTLFIAGDAERPLEEYLCSRGYDMEAQIFHAGHHGSSGSTTAALLDRVSPELAVISCGRDNLYGHPARQVLERLGERGIAVRRTDLEGTIVIRGK